VRAHSAHGEEIAVEVSAAPITTAMEASGRRDGGNDVTRRASCRLKTGAAGIARQATDLPNRAWSAIA